MKTLAIGMLLALLAAQPALAHDPAEAADLAAKLAELYDSVEKLQDQLYYLLDELEFRGIIGSPIDVVPLPVPFPEPFPLEPACHDVYVSAFDVTALTGCTLVLSGTPEKFAFTGPGRFYAFEGHPAFPDNVDTGNFVYDPIGPVGTEVIFLGFESDYTGISWWITLTFSSEFEGTYESTYTDSAFTPPIEERTTGTFTIIEEAVPTAAAAAQATRDAAAEAAAVAAAVAAAEAAAAAAAEAAAVAAAEAAAAAAAEAAAQ